jgi:pyruvate/2-oxoglutarate dehydrogenase complex dihydrolipoamide dehydrogenase (E3) component
MKEYDFIIIGSGQAGNPLTFDLASKGYKVALIEKNHLGGSCINTGCTPTKALIASSNLYHRIKKSEGLGIKVKETSLDFPRVMGRKNRIVKGFRESLEEEIKKNDFIDLYRGIAQFQDSKTLSITDNGGEKVSIRGEKIFINTGSKPNIVPFEGIEDVSYLDSTSIMELNKLPKHLIIIGTGYIAMEFGQMFQRFGSKVTMIGRNKNIISHEDEDISNRVQKILEEDGVEFILEADTKKLEKAGEEITVTYTQEDKEFQIIGSHLLIATGRKPHTEELQLENAGVKVDDKGSIIIDKKLKTNIDHIYALGDVKGGPKFTHIAYDDYRIVMEDLFGGGKRNKEDRYVPFTLYTQPQLGRIGLTEKMAKKEGYDFQVATLEMDTQARPIEEGHPKGFAKAIIHKKTEEILGVAILGYQGGEIMAMIQIAMMGKMSYKKLRDGIFTHPSLSEMLNNLFNL